MPTINKGKLFFLPKSSGPLLERQPLKITAKTLTIIMLITQTTH